MTIDNSAATDNKSLYIILTATGTVISRIIKVFTRAPFNHVSITDDDEIKYMFSFARQNAPHLLPSGFFRETVDSGIFGMCSSVPCQIYEISVTKEQHNKFCELMNTFSQSPETYQFNILGFATMIFNIPLRRKTKYMCSQFVAYTLHECGIINFNKDFSLVKPDDFRNLSKLKLIYNGDMKDFTYYSQKITA